MLVGSTLVLNHQNTDESIMTRTRWIKWQFRFISCSGIEMDLMVVGDGNNGDVNDLKLRNTQNKLSVTEIHQISK